MMNPWKLTTLALALVLAFFVGRELTGTASAGPQPHMQNALGSLRAARAELQKADPDKGGHRVKAIELTGAAILQVERGMRFDDKH